MTNILIPTDFSSASIKLAEQALQTVNVNSVNIVFFHLFELPYSEFELLDPSRKKPYAHVMTDSFRQSCKQLKDQHSKAINKICFKFLEGNSAPLFRNFIDANEIDMIFCPDHYLFTAVHKLSADPRPVFKKSGVNIIREQVAAQTETVIETTRVIQPELVLIPANS
ncbi:MAG: universal stress protein [Sphingobacteriales bacterium]|nr:MAG: universal stress protein [Sphingobacteriales bacterium]